MDSGVTGVDGRVGVLTDRQGETESHKTRTGSARERKVSEAVYIIAGPHPQ